MQNSDQPGHSFTRGSGGSGEEEEKRAFERVLFNEFLGIYTLIESEGLQRVQLIDISSTGCRFEMKKEDGKFEVGDEWAFRMYFTRNTYLPAMLKIIHGYFLEIEGVEYVGYGAAFDRTLTTFPCLSTFIDIIYCYADHAIEDKHNKQIFF